MVSQQIRLIECNYFEITMPMITLDPRIGVCLARYHRVSRLFYEVTSRCVYFHRQEPPVFLYIVEFASGRSFRDRTLFIDICSEVLQLFSRAFFKENFYECVLELSSDSVPNIRLRWVNYIPLYRLDCQLVQNCTHLVLPGCFYFCCLGIPGLKAHHMV